MGVWCPAQGNINPPVEKKKVTGGPNYMKMLNEEEEKETNTKRKFQPKGAYRDEKSGSDLGKSNTTDVTRFTESTQINVNRVDRFK